MNIKLLKIKKKKKKKQKKNITMYIVFDWGKTFHNFIESYFDYINFLLHVNSFDLK